MKVYFFTLLILISTPMMAQNNMSAVRLDNYLIDPVNKTISRFEYWERDYPDGRHAWGEDCKVDTTIDFNTTCLYVGFGVLEFKEYYKPYILTVKVLDDAQNPVDMSTYTPFANYYIGSEYHSYYACNGEYYYLVYAHNSYLLKKLKILPNVDFAKLTPAGSNYYYDDKALYFVENVGRTNQQLVEVADGDNCKPIMKTTHCVYNGVAYYSGGMALSEGAKRIDANPADLLEIDMYGRGRVDDISFIDRSKDIIGVSKWKLLASFGILELRDSCVYLPSPIQETNPSTVKSTVTGVLLATPSGFLVARDYQFKDLRPINNVFIFNCDKKEYEEIDTAQFQLRTIGYEYRGRLYYGGVPVTTGVDAPYLKYNTPITGELDLANLRGFGKWFTDGKRLINMGSVRYEGNGADKRVSLGKAVPIADVANIQSIFYDDNLLVDGVNFYIYTYGDIRVVPIKDLGVEVKFVNSAPY